MTSRPPSMARTSPCSSAPGRVRPAWSAVTCCRPTAGSSAPQSPDLYNTVVTGRSPAEQVEEEWPAGTFIPEVAQRGAAIIKARGASSAASAASAALNHVYDWVNGTDWTSAAVVSDGSYN